MSSFICVICGVQHSSASPPQACPICEDERQWVNRNGQQWITPQALAAAHSNQFRGLEPNLFEIKTTPPFAITQRALLVQSKEGNVLWDCLSLIDQATVEKIKSLGGIQAIAISHPHFYASMVDWSRAFGHVPIYIHEADKQFVMRRDPAIVFWKEQSRPLNTELTLVHCGGHFPGSSVLHWNRGALLTGDTIFVTQDTRYVSFMYSYPNLIPLGAEAIEKILKAVEPFDYDRIYNGWSCCEKDAKKAVAVSAARYLKHISP